MESNDQIINYTECFAIYQKNGTLNVNLICKALQSLQIALTNSQLHQIKQQLLNEEITELTFDKFLEVVKSNSKQIDYEDELLHALRFFDQNGDGTVSAAELRNTLTTIGEAISRDELEALIVNLDADSEGKIRIQDLIRVLTIR